MDDGVASNTITTLLTNCIGDSDADNMDACCPVLCDLSWQQLNVTCWNTISDEDGHVSYVRSIAVSTVKYLRPQYTKPTGRVRVTAVVSYGTDGCNERRFVRVVCKIELKLRIISFSDKQNRIQSS